MAGSGLPTNIDSSYPDSSVDPSWKLHQQYHDLIHAIVNLFDKDATPTNGQVWSWVASAGLYRPTSSIIPAFTANQGMVAFNREKPDGTYDPLPADIGTMAVIWIGADDPPATSPPTRFNDMRYRIP